MKRLAIGTAAIVIVFALGIVGSKLLPRSTESMTVVVPEQTTVREAIHVAPQPKLKLSPPRASSNVGAAPQSEASQSGSDAQNSAQIARSATISLYVKDVEKAVSAVTALTKLRRGDVLSLDDKRADADTHANAQMQVRVPDARFTDTLSALAATGTVRAQGIAAEDLTGQIVDSKARLRNLRRTEDDILKIMDRSGSVGQVLEAENQLSQVRERIETTDAEIKSMVGRVQYATIDVTLEAEVGSVPSAPTGVSQLATAWAASTHALVQFTLGILASLIWILTFVPYLLAIFLIGIALRRWLLRPAS